MTTRYATNPSSGAEHSAIAPTAPGRDNALEEERRENRDSQRPRQRKQKRAQPGQDIGPARKKQKKRDGEEEKQRFAVDEREIESGRKRDQEREGAGRDRSAMRVLDEAVERVERREGE
jgi:hypothetical protein